ncbi:DUF551 domain-containing protein [uncultured Parabacteroides sp.]|jgi:hypothetical protein|uniref:DUF551 domain-containing protein n=1 Tax=uncultured Parabacteroides sp. TaxID=512312 RepID=UPI0025E0585A|nr:DUF551 domain-containing protein [uncultured Parabacteroides sp.]
MENKLQQAAKAYQEKEHEIWTGKGMASELQKAFIAGAEWQQQQSPWISIDERMPEDNQLVLTSSGIYGTKLLVWNAFHGVWDDEDGDDVYCERDKIDAWMPIPE